MEARNSVVVFAAIRKQQGFGKGTDKGFDKGIDKGFDKGIDKGPRPNSLYKRALYTVVKTV